MGTYYKACEAHLAPMVWAYTPNAQNGAVTVKVIKNPKPNDLCAYCFDIPNFEVSFHPEKK